MVLPFESLGSVHYTDSLVFSREAPALDNTEKAEGKFAIMHRLQYGFTGCNIGGIWRGFRPGFGTLLPAFAVTCPLRIWAICN